MEIVKLNVKFIRISLKPIRKCMKMVVIQDALKYLNQITKGIKLVRLNEKILELA